MLPSSLDLFGRRNPGKLSWTWESKDWKWSNAVSRSTHPWARESSSRPITTLRIEHCCPRQNETHNYIIFDAAHAILGRWPCPKPVNSHSRVASGVLEESLSRSLPRSVDLDPSGQCAIHHSSARPKAFPKQQPTQLCVRLFALFVPTLKLSSFEPFSARYPLRLPMFDCLPCAVCPVPHRSTNDKARQV